MASKAVIREMKDFAGMINSCGIKLKKMILFGSYASGKQTKYSDIDVALVADEFCGVPSEDVKLIMNAMLKYYMVQPQTYNTRDFVPENNPFVAEIIKTGIEI